MLPDALIRRQGYTIRVSAGQVVEAPVGFSVLLGQPCEEIIAAYHGMGANDVDVKIEGCEWHRVKFGRCKSEESTCKRRSRPVRTDMRTPATIKAQTQTKTKTSLPQGRGIQRRHHRKINILSVKSSSVVKYTSQ